jgi:hypothetical protein
MARNGWRGGVLGLGTLAWGVAASATTSAQVQSPATSEPVPSIFAPTHDRGGISGLVLASAQGDPFPPIPTAPGLGPAAWGTGLSLDRLVRMGPAELEQLYAGGTLGPIPPGKVRGQALLDPGTRLAVPKSRASRLVWQGKIFRSDGQSAINRFFGIRMIKADVYVAESWRDGRPALILDYSRTSMLYAPYRDEIRQVAPGLYLGLMFDRRKSPPSLKMYFALECPPGG